LQRWGIDIVGPLTTAQGNYKFTVVAVEYFTKWIEVKPLVNIVAVGLKRFFWQNIICRFGVPREITVDNAKQFDYHLFRDFYYQMGVEATFASVYHPQSNGVVEKANTLKFIAMKKILESQSKSKWAEEL
jgi:transposase InsO family protein